MNMHAIRADNCHAESAIAYGSGKSSMSAL